MTQLIFFAAGMLVAVVACVVINAVCGSGRMKPPVDDGLSPDEWVISSEAMDAISQAARDFDSQLFDASQACAEAAKRTDPKSGCRLIAVEDVRAALENFQPRPQPR